MRLRQAADGARRGRLGLQGLGEMRRRRGRVPGRQRLLAALDGCNPRLCRRGAGEVAHQLIYLAFRHGAEEAVHRPSFAEDHHGGNRGDAQLLGDLGIGLDIHLHQPHRALVLAYGLFEQGRELAAGGAAGPPEIHQHRRLHGGFQHIGDEVLRVGFLDPVAGRGGRGGGGGVAVADNQPVAVRLVVVGVCHGFSFMDVRAGGRVSAAWRGRASPARAARGRPAGA